jgi:glycosyltransferase involved in cell wall biosynthesis
VTTSKILLWHWNRKGGGPRYTWELAQALALRRDIEVALSFSRQSEFAGVMRDLQLPSLEIDTYTNGRDYLLGHLRLPGLRRRFGAFLRAEGIDLVISTMSHLWSPFVAPAVRRATVPYCLVAHDAEPHPGEASPLRRWALARDIAQAEMLVAPTHAVAGRLRELRPDLPAERIAVIPLGSFSFGEAPHPPRTLPDDRPIELLFFGRLLAYKGVDILAEAYRLLRSRYGGRLRLRIAGLGSEADYRTLLSDLPGLTWDNRWIAEEEVDRLLAEADILLLPYREASQSGSLAAAETAALPSVATPVGGLIEEITAYGSGAVAAEVTGPAFAEAVAGLIESPERYAACSKAALASAQGPKSWPRIAELFADFVRRML